MCCYILSLQILVYGYLYTQPLELVGFAVDVVVLFAVRSLRVRFFAPL
jgi:hypothetical protein